MLSQAVFMGEILLTSHPIMKRLSTLLLITSIFSASLDAEDGHITYEGKSGPGKGKHVVLLTGDEEYRGEEGLPMMARF